MPLHGAAALRASLGACAKVVAAPFAEPFPASAALDAIPQCPQDRPPSRQRRRRERQRPYGYGNASKVSRFVGLTCIPDLLLPPPDLHESFASPSRSQ